MAEQTDTLRTSAIPAPPRAGPAAWRNKKRPPEPKHQVEREARTHFDVRLAGAAAAGRWEDDWPQLTEAEFDAALQAAGEVELGGHNPDGSHPRGKR